MQLQLSELIKARMKSTGQDRTQFARSMGYRNLAKGRRLLDNLLTGERLPVGDQPGRLAQALGVSDADVKAAAQADATAQRWEAQRQRALDPRYFLTTRIFAACYITKKIPTSISLREAIEIASAKAKQLGPSDVWRCCLQAPDSTCMWFDGTGQILSVTEGAGPVMTVAHHAFAVEG